MNLGERGNCHHFMLREKLKLTVAVQCQFVEGYLKIKQRVTILGREKYGKDGILRGKS